MSEETKWEPELLNSTLQLSIDTPPSPPHPPVPDIQIEGLKWIRIQQLLRDEIAFKADQDVSNFLCKACRHFKAFCYCTLPNVCKIAGRQCSLFHRCNTCNSQYTAMCTCVCYCCEGVYDEETF